MKKLTKKVFITIFLIISIFLLSGIIIYNVNIYKREYEGIYRNLNFISNNKPNDNFISRPNMDNMMIMDYEVYTVKLDNKNITKIIGHNNKTSDFDVRSIANNIINNANELKIGNLYTSTYAYNYKFKDTIIIMNLNSINNKLNQTLFISILYLIVLEIIIYFISKMMTKWITKPAIDSFNKQKEFIADASHELKTPLAIIMASSDELTDSKKNAKYIENIKYESDRMSKLIKELLDLSKLESDIKEYNYKDENISKIVEKISLTFEGIAFENGIKIDTHIEDNIYFNSNKDDIEKLISIILDNTIKHSYKDTTIVVSMKKIKNTIDIEITNTGDPIIKGDEEKIFERFYRADKSRNRSLNRYGLGLAIAKSIVTNHNGVIKAFSASNKTTFKIILKK